MTADVKLLPLPDTYSATEVAMRNDGRWVRREDFDWYIRQERAHATAAKDAKIEALRAEVERLTSLTAVTMGVGRGDGSLFVHGDYESIKAAQALVFRAERLAEALRIAIRQNSHDMLMTGDELRQCEAALNPTAAQGDEAASA